MIDRIEPQINIDEEGNISWVPSLVDYDASLFYRGKTITNDEFNELFLQRTYQANYLSDSLNAILNNYLNEAIRKRVAAEGVSAEELNNALADYYTATEIDDVINTVRSEIPDISNLASTDQIPTKVSQLENDNNYISSIPNYYVTEESLILKDYATNTRVNNIANTIPTKVSDLINDLNFLSSIPNEYVTETELSAKNFATKSEIPDISNLATKDELPNLDDFDLSEYAKKTDIPDISNLASKNEIPTKVSELENDSGFITAAEIPEGGILYNTTGQNTDGAMSQAASTNAFALKSEIPDTSNFLPKSEKSHPVIFIRGTVPEEEVGQISRQYQIFDEKLNIGDKVRLFYCKFDTDTASLYLNIQECTGKIDEVTSDYYKYSIISGYKSWFIPAILSSVCVTLTGEQTVSGNKTFTGTVIVPDISF